MMGMAEPKVTSPVLDSACRMPTEAEEDWMMTVTTTPTSTPRTGLVMLTKSSWKAALSRRGRHAGVHQAHAREQDAKAQHDLSDVLLLGAADEDIKNAANKRHHRRKGLGLDEGEPQAVA